MSTATAIAGSKPKQRRWTQFSLRTLLVAISIVAICLGWFFMKLREAGKQHRAIQAILMRHGHYVYDFEYVPFDSFAGTRTRRPEWLIKLLSVDFLHDVASLRFYNEQLTDYDCHLLLEDFSGLPKLQELDFGATQLAIWHWHS